MTTPTTDRRLAGRRTTAADHGIVSARVRPGYRAAVVDVSANGVLIETECRLLPGSAVHLHMTRAKDHTTIRGRVIRSAVSGLKPSSVCYRGAIGFDHPLSWFAEDDGSDGYRIPNPGKRAGHGFRADATPQVV
jgi:hypothetical protein